MRPITLGLLCGVGLGLVSCGGDPNSFLINLNNIPDNTQSVQVSAKLGGKAAQETRSITSPLDRFGVALDQGASGQLVLDIQAIDPDGCSKASGTAAFDLPTGFQSSTVSLALLSPRKCGALPACAANTVCTVPGKPQGLTSTLQAFWAVSPQDIWGVGNSATIIHYDGTSWSVVAPPTGFQFDINGIWGSSATDLWAVGQAGSLLHYDGSKWRDLTTSSPTGQTLFGVWGLGSKDIYAAGDSLTTSSQGAVLHYNGASWSSISDIGIPTGRLNAIWADNTGSTLVYVCGVSGNLARYNGTTWDLITSGTAATLHGIWGTSDHTVFAVGDNSKILRIRYSDGPGAQWNPISNVPSSTTLWAVRGDSGGAVYATGNSGVVLRSDPPYDTFVSQTGSTSFSLFALTPTSTGLVWLGGLSGYLGFLDSRP